MKRIACSICLMAAAACASVTGSPEPPATSSDVSELGNSCSVSCNNARTQCEATCERFPRPNCETSCDQRFSNCMHACGCPFSEESDHVSFDHADPTSTLLCVGPFNARGVYYQQYNTFQRTDHVRDTLQCDGTFTEIVLSSTVSAAGPCFHRLFPDSPCPQSQTSATGLCTF
jgi:hypothetical protein